jgi:hypothetical protein
MIFFPKPIDYLKENDYTSKLIACVVVFIFSSFFPLERKKRDDKTTTKLVR